MTEKQEAPDGGPVGRSSPRAAQGPRLAEDVLLLLFQPTSNSIAGEGTLFYVLAGAVVADLALHGQVEERRSGRLSRRVHAIGAAPEDDLLRTAWDYLAEKPRGVHSVLAAIGPGLRAPLLDRLVEHGHIRREEKRVLGIFASTALELQGSRRAELLAEVRATLVDGKEPAASVAALAALLWASGTLPQFDPEIPWSSSVIERAHELKGRSWPAAAVAAAVTRTTGAVVAPPAVGPFLPS